MKLKFLIATVLAIAGLMVAGCATLVAPASKSTLSISVSATFGG
jgi:hypothetical protein